MAYEGSTPGDIYGYTGSPKKLMSKCNWDPKVEFTDGIEVMVKCVI